MSNNLPNFLVVGAAKSGTSSLHNYLNQHPEIFMPSFRDGVNVKEPQFFVRESVMDRLHSGIWNWQDYKDLFFQVKDEKAIGEASVFYLYYFEEAINNIKKYLGDQIKIIIILRNPIDRAYSAYQHVSRSMKEELSFEEALDSEKERLIKDTNITPMIRYYDMGLYYNMVQAYMQNFNNVHLILHDDFLESTEEEIKKVFNFLGVKDSVKVNTKRKYNVGGLSWKSKTMKSFLLNNNIVKRIIKKLVTKKVRKTIWKRIIILFTSKTPRMKHLTRKTLIMKYKNDIVKLSNLINRDLTRWLN